MPWYFNIYYVDSQRVFTNTYEAPSPGGKGEPVGPYETQQLATEARQTEIADWVSDIID